MRTLFVQIFVLAVILPPLQDHLLQGLETKHCAKEYLPDAWLILIGITCCTLYHEATLQKHYKQYLLKEVVNASVSHY